MRLADTSSSTLLVLVARSNKLSRSSYNRHPALEMDGQERFHCNGYSGVRACKPVPVASNRHLWDCESTPTRTCFRGPRRRNWKWISLIICSSPRIPLFIRLNASCERKMSLWRSNKPRLTHVKMVMRNASRRLSTLPSTVSAGLALEIDLTKNVTKESREYWYMWSIRHLSRSGAERSERRTITVSEIYRNSTKRPAI